MPVENYSGALIGIGPFQEMADACDCPIQRSPYLHFLFSSDHERTRQRSQAVLATLEGATSHVLSLRAFTDTFPSAQRALKAHRALS
jgi:hypothetical protein